MIAGLFLRGVNEEQAVLMDEQIKAVSEMYLQFHAMYQDVPTFIFI